MVESENSPVADAAEEQANEAEKLNQEVEIQEVSSCQRHVKVTISRDDVEKYFEREYDELVEKAIVPGFRVGKAPRKIIEKKFKSEVIERVKQGLLLDSLSQISDSNDLIPISEPDLNVKAVTLPDEGPFVYEYNIEVRPAFDVPNWKGLKIEKPTREFTDADVDRAIETIRQNYGSLLESEKPAEPGDFIVAALTFTHDGKEISKAESETIRIRPTLSFHDGSIADFDKLMTGVKPGDTVTAKALLTDSTPNVELRGKEIDATFQIKEVKELIVPDLDAEFLDEVGGFRDMGDFRDAILETLKRQLDHEQRKRARQQITAKLTESVTLDLPPALLERQSKRELQRAILELRRSGFDDSQILPQINFLRQNSNRVTAQALKEHFILEKIAETENIEDQAVDYDVEIALIAAQANVSPRKVRSQLEKAGEMDILRNQIIERKVIDLILAEAVFTEVPWEMEGDQEEALDRAAGSDATEEGIPEVSEEEVKEAKRNAATEAKMKKD